MDTLSNANTKAKGMTYDVKPKALQKLHLRHINSKQPIQKSTESYHAVVMHAYCTWDTHLGF